MHGHFDRQLLYARLYGEQLGDRVRQGPKRDRMNSRGIYHDRNFDRQIGGEIRDDAPIVHDPRFDELLAIIRNPVDDSDVTLARWCEPMRRYRGRSGENVVAQLCETCASGFVLSASVSTSTSELPESPPQKKRSLKKLRPNDMLPAPMNTILVLFAIPHGPDSLQEI